MPLLYHKKEGFISRIFIGYFEVTKDEVITKEHPPTDDGTAMVVFIYGILKTLLVMFFDWLPLKPGDKYQRKKQYIRDGP